MSCRIPMPSYHSSSSTAPRAQFIKEEGGLECQGLQQQWESKLGDLPYVFEEVIKEHPESGYFVYLRDDKEILKAYLPTCNISFEEEDSEQLLESCFSCSKEEYIACLREIFLNTTFQKKVQGQLLSDYHRELNSGCPGNPRIHLSRWDLQLSDKAAEILEELMISYQATLLWTDDQMYKILKEGRCISVHNYISAYRPLPKEMSVEDDDITFTKAMERLISDGDLERVREFIQISSEEFTLWQFFLHYPSLFDYPTAEKMACWAIGAKDLEALNRCIELCPSIINSDSILKTCINRSLNTLLSIVSRRKAPIPLSIFQNFIQMLKNERTDFSSEEMETANRIVEAFSTRVEDSKDWKISATSSLSLIDLMYLYEGRHRKFMQELLCTFLRHKKGSTTQHLKAHVLHNLRSDPAQIRYLEYLLRDGQISDEEYRLFSLKRESLDVKEGMEQEAISRNAYLQNLLSVYNFNPLLISLSEIEEMLSLKRMMKAYLKEHTQEDCSRLQNCFGELQRTIQKLKSRHHLLNELREIRKELKSLEHVPAGQRAHPISKRILRFHSLFSEVRSPQGLAQIYTNKESAKPFLRRVINRVFQAASSVLEDPWLASKRVLWVHGSQASSLPIMQRFGGIVPMGTLLDEGGVSFSGALRGSEGKINKEGISGEMMTSSWDEQIADSIYPTRFLISKSYAYMRNEIEEASTQDSWDHLTCEKLDALLSMTDASCQHNWTYVLIAILRVRYTQPGANEKLQTYREYIETRMKTFDGYVHTQLTRLHRALVTEIIPLNKEELDQTHNPYPIVFASLTAHNTQHILEGVDQFLFPGIAKFREDIQVAFTTREHIEALKSQLEPLGIRVYDIDAAPYLEMEHMMCGSFHEKIKDQHPLQRIAMVLQRDVIPLYVVPFPEHPRYQEDGKEKLLRPNFAQGSHKNYLKAIQEGTVLARDIHGPVHAMRTAIWSLMLRNLYKLQGREEIQDLFLLALAAAFHDARREDEGKDRWDEESGDALFGYLKALGFYSVEVIESFVHAIKEKDPKGDFTTDIQRCIHDADVLEIMRCPGIGIEKFDPQQLCCVKEGLLPLNLQEKLLPEVNVFISMTDALRFKLEFQKASENGFLDLLQLIYQNKEQFPLISELLVEELSIFDSGGA